MRLSTGTIHPPHKRGTDVCVGCVPRRTPTGMTVALNNAIGAWDRWPRRAEPARRYLCRFRTHDQFLEVFAAYNSGLWFAAAILWLLTAGAVVWLASGRAGGLWIGALLVVHWLWSGAVYHLGYFAEINPAARMFGIAFIVGGWTFGVVRVRALSVRVSVDS
jgi:Family of unknown function (DUF6064)